MWLCDSEQKVIADFPFPYARFARGTPASVTLQVPLTNVPPDFVIFVGFNPTATKGVFVHYDAAGSGNSLVGLPGARSQSFATGDWLIRAEVDQLKAADALSGAE